MLTPTGITDASGEAQEAHFNADAGFRCATSICSVGTKADAVLLKPTKIACGPCIDATRAAPPWYFIASAAGIVGMHIAGAL